MNISGDTIFARNASPALMPASSCSRLKPSLLVLTLLVATIAMSLVAHTAVAAEAIDPHDYVLHSIGVLLLIQTGLTVALLVQDRHRRRAKHDLERLHSDMTHAARLALAGEITASIAHEVAQPLSAILSNVETAELLLAAPEQNAAVLADILVDIKRDDLRANEIVCRLRTLLRKRDLKLERTDINELIDNVVALVRTDTTRRNVIVKTALASDLPLLDADPVHLQQVLLNLMINAMDAMQDIPPTARWLEICSRNLPDCVEIAVLDTGHGMTEKELARAFESFFTTKEAGMGLGLSIARSIVKSHGGTLSAEHRIEGGMIFRLCLPRRSPLAEGYRKAV